jgi:hypothetical protein
MAANQIKRMAEKEDIERAYDMMSVGEMCQWASTLLVLQGVDDIDPAHKDKVVSILERWETRYKGVFAGETTGRVLGALTGDPTMTAMSNMVRRQLERALQECNLPSCSLMQRPTGEDLQQCTKYALSCTLPPILILQTLRCKAARYVSGQLMQAI